MELDSTDAIELAETLDFLRDWLSADAAALGQSLRRFVGTDGYDLSQLQADLDRFVFLLGGSDGERLFSP